MSHYRYPRENYKCGYSDSGETCLTGPHRGKCSRSQLPNPCRPIRTLKWWSRTLQILLSLVALIFVSVAYSNVGSRRLLAPGPLSSPHAQLLVRDASSHSSGVTIHANNRCAACHPGGTSENMSNDPSHVTDSTTSQSMLCLNCHKDSMPDAVHGTPHDLHGTSLQMLVRKNAPPTKMFFTSWLMPHQNSWEKSSTQCGQCHREHQGENHNLRSISSQKCQNCHARQFASFSHGHPEFENYPKTGKRNIAFDHTRHQQLHFVKKNSEFHCQTCHIQNDQSSAVGQVIRSVSFEQACASCHAESIKSSLQDGLIVLQLPSIYEQGLAKYGIDIRPWPIQASQMNDGVIPPLMRLLIQSEPHGNSLLSKLPTNGRISDIDLNDPGARQTLRELVHTTREMIKRLADDGQPGFRMAFERLINEQILQSNPNARNVPSGPNIDPHDFSPWLDQFAKGIPPDLFRAAYLEWFANPANQNTGVVSNRIGQPTAEVRLSSRIRDVDDDLLSGSNNLLDTPKKELQGTNLLESTPLRSESPAESDSRSPRFVDAKAWQQLNFGGWMIDRQRMAIVYVPSGHADEWLSRWIEIDEIETKSRSSGIAPEMRSRPDAVVQQCRSCHALNGGNDPGIPNNSTWLVAFQKANGLAPSVRPETPKTSNNPHWRSHRSTARIKPLTRFDHTPHLTLPKTRDCTQCHNLIGTANDTPHSISDSEFQPLLRSQCTSCHQPTGAGESCTQCHNYHIGEKSWWISQ